MTIEPGKPNMQTTSRRGTKRRVVGALAVMAMLAAGCSSSSKDSGISKGGGGGSSGGGGGGAATVPVGKGMTVDQASKSAVQLLGPIKYATGSTTRGIKGKVITIGGVAEVKDAGGLENFLGVCDGAKARFERANREGGVNGYTFDYVGCSDTGGSADLAKSQVQQMVEKKKVFAILPKTTTSGGVGDYLNKQKVPYFGWGIDPDYCGWSNRQFGFAITSAISCSNVVKGKTFFSGRGLDQYVQGTSKKAADVKWALVGSNDAAAVGAVKAFTSIIAGEGSKLAYKTNAIPATGSPPLSDYTPIAREIISSGATVTLMSTGAGPIFALVPALRANGYKGDVVIPFADSRLLAVVGQIDKTYAETPNLGSLIFDSKQFRQVAADLKAIGSKQPADGLGSATSYGSADLFIEALKKVKGPLTTESFAKTLNRGFTYPNLGNVVCGSIWPASHVVPANCGALVQFLAADKSMRRVADLKNVGNIYLFSSR